LSFATRHIYSTSLFKRWTDRPWLHHLHSSSSSCSLSPEQLLLLLSPEQLLLLLPPDTTDLHLPLP
jgi:hypothetical protein